MGDLLVVSLLSCSLQGGHGLSSWDKVAQVPSFGPVCGDWTLVPGPGGKVLSAEAGSCPPASTPEKAPLQALPLQRPLTIQHPEAVLGRGGGTGRREGASRLCRARCARGLGAALCSRAWLGVSVAVGLSQTQLQWPACPLFPGRGTSALVFEASWALAALGPEALVSGRRGR